MPDRLENEPFSFIEMKDDRVHILHQGKIAKVLRGKEAVKFLSRVEGQDERDQQLVMAKVTGQFKFGNER